MTKQKTIILASGGTGGHLFPACSLASLLIDKNYNVLMLTDKRGETFIGKFDRPIPYRVIQSATFGAGIIGKFMSAGRIIIGTLQSFGILLNTKATAVVAFGGYPCFPPALAAGVLRIPVVLHEQNAIPGRANRALAKFARFIAVSSRNTENFPQSMKTKIRFTGNPLRRDISEKAKTFSYSISETGKPFRMLIVGGSQGAKIMSDIVPAAMALLPENIRRNISVVQQARNETLDAVRTVYAGLNFAEPPILAPFISNMAEILTESHLVIGRAGAAIISELTALGIPAIYVPLAASLDGDQAKNAEEIVQAGGGIIINEKDFTALTLAQKIEYYVTHPGELKTMADNAKKLGTLNAGESLCSLVTSVASGGKP